MSVKIIVDSTADLIPSVKEKVTVVPLTVCFGNEEFLDGVTIDHKQFYEKLVECDVPPFTSQPTPAAFEEVFQRVTAAGDSAVVITISSKLSGTYQSAVIAAADYEQIHVVDSCSATIASGILTEYALACVEKGMTAEALADTLERKKGDVCLIAMLDTLEYLKRGGRISPAAAFAGGILNIKPVINIKDGAINVIGKARGSKQGNNLLIQEIEKAGGIDFDMPILLGYTGLSDVLLKKYIEDSKAIWENRVNALNYATIGSVVGTHAGPGAIAVAFFKQ